MLSVTDTPGYFLAFRPQLPPHCQFLRLLQPDAIEHLHPLRQQPPPLLYHPSSCSHPRRLPSH